MLQKWQKLYLFLLWRILHCDGTSLCWDMDRYVCTVQWQYWRYAEFRCIWNYKSYVTFTEMLIKGNLKVGKLLTVQEDDGVKLLALCLISWQRTGHVYYPHRCVWSVGLSRKLAHFSRYSTETFPWACKHLSHCQNTLIFMCLIFHEKWIQYFLGFFCTLLC